ncbi:MAG: hypothetical protein H0T05_04915 [Acidobacteria bacterium]|nr:hypothetical protein [Acidobacteriota bacterium]MBA3887131.1 hypothetical protein [Acidobacteriota bacterium]
MRNDLKQALIAFVAAWAVLAVGCGGDRADHARTAEDGAGSASPISLNGCIGVAPGRANEFALQHVRVTSAGEQPSLTQPSAQPHAVNEGSWVRLATADGAEQLRERVGERVTIVGTIRDDGRDLVGTSGPQPGPQQADPRPDESRAGADLHHSEKVAQEAGPIGQQSMATGTAPLVMVQRIEGTGEPCSPELRQPRDR